MNMLVNYMMKALAASTTLAPEAVKPQVRTELVRKYDRHSGTFYTVQQVVRNHKRLKSRGKGGKTAHSFSGVRAVKRAAVKRRNRKG